MSTHEDDGVIEFQTPAAARITAKMELNGAPEIDGDDDSRDNDIVTGNVNVVEETNIDNEKGEEGSVESVENNHNDNISDSQPEIEQSSPLTAETNTTQVDLDIVDETATYEDIIPTVSNTPFSNQSANTARAQDDDNSPQDENDSLYSTDEFGNPIYADKNNQYFGGDGFNSEQNELQDDFNFDPDPVRALEAKARGNKHFAQGQYEDALECYAESLLFCPEDALAERVLYHNNKCAAHIMLKQWDDAVFEAHCVLGIEGDNVKALTRRAKAFEQLEQYQEAIEDYKKLGELEPKIKLYKEKELELTKKNEEKFEKQKTEMVDKLKGWGNSFLGMFGMSTDNFQFQQDPASGSYSVNFVQNPGEQPQQPQQSQQPQQHGPTQPGSSSFSFSSGR
jgi:tetratricopeptide (TPR) repeat protein